MGLAVVRPPTLPAPGGHGWPLLSRLEAGRLGSLADARRAFDRGATRMRTGRPRRSGAGRPTVRSVLLVGAINCAYRRRAKRLRDSLQRGSCSTIATTQRASLSVIGGVSVRSRPIQRTDARSKRGSPSWAISARISRLSARLIHWSSAAAGRMIESLRVSRERRKFAYGPPFIDTNACSHQAVGSSSSSTSTTRTRTAKSPAQGPIRANETPQAPGLCARIRPSDSYAETAPMERDPRGPEAKTGFLLECPRPEALFPMACARAGRSRIRIVRTLRAAARSRRGSAQQLQHVPAARDAV
jgi:hypothetical protein